MANLLDARTITARKVRSINGHPFKILMQQQDTLTVIYQDAKCEAHNVKAS